MRMWDVPPKLLCQKHLLGEHVEMHMFVGTILKKISIQGYIDNGLVNPKNIQHRHTELAEEMLKRNLNHQSPLKRIRTQAEHPINIPENLKELSRRCSACKQRISGMVK